LNRTSFKGASATDTATATYDNQDRLLRYKNTRYTYSAAGELASKMVGTDTTRYTYDALGNLLKVRFQNGDTVTYVVDGMNRRVGRKWNGTWSRGWMYRAISPLAELDSAGAVLSRYIYGTNGVSPSLMVRGNTTYRIVSDYLGSVRAIVALVSGSTAQKLDFGEWGMTLDTVGGAAFQTLG
jgi:YD repeat-containing protein